MKSFNSNRKMLLGYPPLLPGSGIHLLYLVQVLLALFSVQLIHATDTIPVVVHIVYANDQQNIPDVRIYEQIAALNRDFQLKNEDTTAIDADFKPLASSVDVVFQLAGIDPESNTTNGISRTATSHGVFGNNDIFFDQTGGKSTWGDRYLNIWVCDLTPGIFGRSSNPNDIDETDGVVIDFAYFGKNTGLTGYERGRTAVHEVGHWLGLTHLEGLGGCENDDGIEDTPVQDGGYYQCDENLNSCDSKDMLQNFMQLGDDNCLLFFTYGQVGRIKDVLQNERKTMIDHAQDVLSIHKNSAKDKLIFPNPVRNSKIYCNLPTQNDYEFVLTTALGEKRLSGAFDGNVIMLPDALEDGFYLLSVEGRGSHWRQRILILQAE